MKSKSPRPVSASLGSSDVSIGGAPILFGGVPQIPDAEVFAKARKNNPLWFQVFEKAYEQFAQMPEHKGIYPAPKGKGATLEQVWRFSTVWGIEMYCVLAHTMPDDQTKGIRRLQKCSPEQLIHMLQKLCGYGELGQCTLTYDGKTGHCILVKAYDPERDRFIYHDPWPSRSLLCKENNFAGVDAQPEGRRWSVTSPEFERVIFASFLTPWEWARLNGVEFDLAYDQWRKSEFFRFFHIRLLDERTENGMTVRGFTAGPFKDSVALEVVCRGNGKIITSRLMLDQRWIAQNLMIGVDIAKSFIIAFAPPPDKAIYEEISESLWKLRDLNVARSLRQQEPDGRPVSRWIHAFLGGVENAEVSTDFGCLSITNVADKTRSVLELGFLLY